MLPKGSRGARFGTPFKFNADAVVRNYGADRLDTSTLFSVNSFLVTR
jgi:hypothetical protein